MSQVVDAGRTVAELVVERPSRARVLERAGIDYCCGGKRPLAEACAAKRLALDEVLEALAESDTTTVDETNWAEASMTELADHIESTHHDYLKRELPRLAAIVDKVATVHGERHDWLADVRGTYYGLATELDSHMMKEEQILFPICRQMESGNAQASAHCGSVQNPIRVMEHEHDDAGQALARLRQLTSDYTPPEGACNTFRVMLASLAELEQDLHQHIHKENNILFPRAAAREAELAGN